MAVSSSVSPPAATDSQRLSVAVKTGPLGRPAVLHVGPDGISSSSKKDDAPLQPELLLADIYGAKVWARIARLFKDNSRLIAWFLFCRSCAAINSVFTRCILPRKRSDGRVNTPLNVSLVMPLPQLPICSNVCAVCAGTFSANNVRVFHC